MGDGDEHGRKFTNNSKQDVNQGHAHKHVSAGDLWDDRYRKGSNVSKYGQFKLADC